MELLTLEKERSRLSNILYAEKNAHKYMRRVRIHDYIPGQAVYNLGEYPARFSIKPTEYDYNRIKELSEMGVGLIQLHEEWNDAIRVLGADKFTSHDESGLREFIDLCHKFNIKIIPYFSSGFFDERDPDFKESFTRGKYSLNSMYYRYRMCDAGSAEWTNYLTRKVSKILEDYEFDGLYNDMGYDGDAILREANHSANLDNMEYDPLLEDLLVRFYSLVKEKGGIMKIHQNCSFCPPAKDKVYDYLWVGEAVDSTESLMKTAAFNPYVIVAPDYSFIDKNDSEKIFAQALPFLQFLLRPDGRPVTGIERISVPGIDYIKSSDDEKGFFELVVDYNKTHPNGPYVYSEWSAIPDDPKQREKWAEYLKMYKPMVKENSVCFVDIEDCRFVHSEKPKDVHISLFINEDKYICMSNLGERMQKIIFCDDWIDMRTEKICREIDIKPNEVYFLKGR